MAYPEPIPALNAKHSKQFMKKLDEFKLDDQQKEFYKEARERFKKGAENGG